MGILTVQVKRLSHLKFSGKLGDVYFTSFQNKLHCKIKNLHEGKLKKIIIIIKNENCGFAGQILVYRA